MPGGLLDLDGFGVVSICQRCIPGRRRYLPSDDQISFWTLGDSVLVMILFALGRWRFSALTSVRPIAPG